MSQRSGKPTIRAKYHRPFMKAVFLAHALGQDGLALLPGCWEQRVDADWWLALNAHAQPLQCSHGHELDSMEAVFEYRGEAVAFVPELIRGDWRKGN
jgi:hypothetical protein